MKRFCTFLVILITLSCGLNIAFAQEVSIRRLENTPEVSLVGQVLEYRIDIDDAASLTGAHLTWSAPDELIDIESTGTTGLFTSDWSNRTFNAADLAPGRVSHVAGWLTFRAISTGSGNLRVTGTLTTLQGTVNVDTQLSIIVRSPDPSTPLPAGGDFVFIRELNADSPGWRSVGIPSITELRLENVVNVAEYEVELTYDANLLGVMTVNTYPGTTVVSVRAGRITLRGSWTTPQSSDLYLATLLYTPIRSGETTMEITRGILKNSPTDTPGTVTDGGVYVGIVDKVVTNVRVTPGDGQLAVAWDPVPRADAYTVRGFGPPDLGYLQERVQAPTTNVTLTNLRNDSEYTIWVSADKDNRLFATARRGVKATPTLNQVLQTGDRSVTIRDPNLRAAVEKALGKASGAVITQTDMLTLTSLEAENAGIEDLIGIELATNLTALYLPGNGISDLSPLTQLKKLKALGLGSNRLSDISPLAQVKSLVELDLGGNQLSDISRLSQLKQLIWLYLSRNQIVDVSPLAHLTNLTALYLSYNQIADFSALAALVKRLERYQNDNQTPTGPNAPVTLPDPNLRAAIEEALGKTKGATITQADMQTLTRFEAEERDIQNLTGIEFAENLGLLYLSDNEISDLSPLAGLTHLKVLRLDDTAISDISPLARLTNLIRLRLNDTAISDVSPLAGLTHLKVLELSHTAISDVSPLARLTNLVRLDLYSTAISDISPLARLTNLKVLELSHTAISDVSPLARLTNLVELSLVYTTISDISALAGLTNLEVLDLHSTAISDISALAGLTNLVKLYLYDAAISDISPLAGLTHLVELYLNENAISDVSPLARLTNLEVLYLNENAISDVSPLARLTNLVELWIDRNRIADFAPIAELVKNLRSYENGAQLKSLTPDSVRISGPRTVTSVVKDYTFTATVKNVSAQGLRGIKVTVDGGETVYTNGVGQAEFKLNFPSVGTHYTVLTFRDEATQSEFKDGFEVEVLEPHSIELVKDTKLIGAGGSYSARFVVRSADGQALEGFQVKMSVGKWVFKTIGTAQVPIPTILRTTQHAIELLRDDDPNSPIKNLNVFGWRVESVASDRINTATTNSEGRAFCRQRLLSTGFYGVSATVMLDGQELLTTSFSAGNAPNLKIIQPGATLSLDDQNAFYRATKGWQRLRNPRKGAATLWGVRDIREYPPVDPPSYRVEVRPPISCGASAPSAEVMATAEKMAPLFAFNKVLVPIPSDSTLDEDVEFPDNTPPPNSTTSFSHSSIRWTPATTVSVDLGAPVITVKFLDGTSDQRMRVKRAFREWESVGALLFFRFVDSGIADIRVTFDDANLKYLGDGSPRGSAIGRSVIGNEVWLGNASDWIDELGSPWFGVSPFDWFGSRLRNLQRKLLEAVEKGKNRPTLWVDPNYWDDPEDPDGALANLHATIMHEIGHALGFLHFQQVKIISAKTAHVDEYSIMDATIPTRGGNVLSSADKKALVNVYLGQSETIREFGVQEVYGSIAINGVDHETWTSNETINTDRDVSIYVVAQEEYSYTPLEVFKWGGECRVEVDIGARGVTADGDIEMSAKVRLYEGDDVDTTDLEDEETIYFTVSLGEFTDESVTVRNRGLGGGDHATVTFHLTIPIIAEAIGGAPESPTIDIASSDVNGDGRVDTADLVLVSNYIRQTGSIDPRVDVNSDGIVTIADLVQVAQYLGQSIYASAPSPVIVPMGLKYATVNGWIDQARVEDDGSLVFHQGIAKLEYLLTLIIPEETALLHNYPNPFNPETWIPYHLAEPADVTLTIYAVDGKVVRRLDLGHQAGGYYQSKSRAAYWNGRNAVGERVASGIYFYTLTAGDFSATKKMLIRK